MRYWMAGTNFKEPGASRSMSCNSSSHSSDVVLYMFYKQTPALSVFK